MPLTLNFAGIKIMCNSKFKIKLKKYEVFEMTQHSLETKEISYFDNLSVRFVNVQLL